MKIKLRNEEDKRKLVTESRKLTRTTPDLHEIFVNFDESPLTRRENARLRTSRKDLKKANPDKEVTIRGRKVYLGNVVVDEFDILNQVFQ